jgi:hypothetical protein
MTIKKLSISRPARGVSSGHWCLAIGAVLAVAACSSPPEPTHKTVEFYRANKDARQAKVAECANDPGALGKTPGCINAKQAAAIEDIGNLRDLPPMGLLEHEDDKARGGAPDRSDNPVQKEE